MTSQPVPPRPVHLPVHLPVHVPVLAPQSGTLRPPAPAPRPPPPIARIELGGGPLVAVALHDGHRLREEVEAAMALDPAGRLREEDPFTGLWTQVAATRVLGTHSRFQVDLNRRRATAVYRTPEDAWGLSVWKERPDPAMVKRSLAEYDRFYETMRRLLDCKAEAHGRFVVLDLHSYNHRRAGPGTEAADPAGNPEVNIGTGTLDRRIWGGLSDRFARDLAAAPFLGRRLDVRANVKFRGGAFAGWVNARYAGRGCALAVEFKKFFMDEWTGRLFAEEHAAVLEVLRAALPGLHEELHGTVCRT